MICLSRSSLLYTKAAVESSFAVAKSLRGLLGDHLRVEKMGFSWRYHVVSSNVVKTIINPFGNSLYHLFMVIWGMNYYHCFTHIIY
jgi:hypothetical protein